MEFAFFVSGVGGQGVQLMCKVMALAATAENRYAMLSSDYGGQMRGGSSLGTVVVGNNRLRALPVVPKANSAIGEYEALGAEARRLVETDGRSAIANINSAAEEARGAIATINRTAEGVEGPLTDFTATGLPQLQQSIQGLEDATRSLEGLVDEVRASPRDFIGRAPTRELEVQP